MKSMEVSKELKTDIECVQNQLKNAIRNHQDYVARLQQDPDDVDLQKEVAKAEEDIVSVAIKQKHLLQKLREEYKAHQKAVKTNIFKNGIEERRSNLSNALNRARKQNITSIRASLVNSGSDDSIETPLVGSPIEQQSYPVVPEDISQNEFLTYFLLATHDVYKEMQKKRAERKRRSTANPQFLYGNKGWEMCSNSKRKRNVYMVSAVSPPNTRQSVRKKQERVSPPTVAPAAQTSPPRSGNNEVIANGNCSIDIKSVFPFPTIPNLPSGLIIERVSPGSSSPDSKICVTCKQPGLLTICEVCSSAFHISCHNRPFAQTPRQCPRCITKEIRTVGSLNVPSGMSVSYVTPSEVSDKIIEKKQLQDKNKNLTAELTQLQDRHSQLTISLKNQKTQQQELLMTQQSTEDKIQQILSFIETIKSPLDECPRDN